MNREAIPTLITPEQFAEMHGLKLRGVLRGIAGRSIPSIRIGRNCLRIREIDAETWAPGRQDRYPVVLLQDFDEPADIVLNDKIVSVVRDYLDKHGHRALLAALDGPPKRRVPIPDRVRRQVVERDGRVCRYCAKRIGPRSHFHIDHVTPFSAGGRSDDPANLVVACIPCNSSKGSNEGFECPTCSQLMWRDQWDLTPHKCRIAVLGLEAPTSVA